MDALLFEDCWRRVGCWAGQIASCAKTGSVPESLVWQHADNGSIHVDPSRPPAGFGKQPWLPIKAATTVNEVLHGALQTWQLADSPFARLYGGPHALASMLAGGLIGAGVGYGGSRLAEQFSPIELDKDRKKVLRVGGTLLGGAAGALPGLMSGLAETRIHDNAWDAFTSKPVLFNKEAAAVRDLIDVKRADDMLFMPSIPVDRFGKALWDDRETPPALRAGAIGLVESASNAMGGLPVVSPWDVARIAVGMGSGYVSGMLVGRVLGALANVPDSTQDLLKRTGMWAGALKAVVPQAFGLS